MKIRHLVFTLLPAMAVADEATTVPADEPMMPPLPEELLSPSSEKAGLPATAQPVISYRAPKNEEQTWLRLFYIKGTDTWPEVFRRMAASSREKDMQMCHGYALWLKGQKVLSLRYDDDLSLSGIHADGHAYGVLFVEASPYGIRVCPMEGYDLTGKNGGVCWQDAPTRLWSWAEAEAFWTELPRLLRSDKGKATSAHDSAVKREVATKGQRMVVFWAPDGYPATSWWPVFARLHAAVGAQRFSLIAPDGLKLLTDVTVPTASGTGTAAPAAPGTPAGTTKPGPAPSAPTPVTEAPPAVAPATPPATTPTSITSPATTTPAPSAEEHSVPEQLHPGSGSPRDVAPPASVRPWALENGVAPSGKSASSSTRPAATPTKPAATQQPPAATPATPPAPPAQQPQGKTRTLQDVNTVLP